MFVVRYFQGRQRKLGFVLCSYFFRVTKSRGDQDNAFVLDQQFKDMLKYLDLL